MGFMTGPQYQCQECGEISPVVIEFKNEEAKILNPGDLFYVSPKPHDSWVIGDQPYISLHFIGADKYIQ